MALGEQDTGGAGRKARETFSHLDNLAKDRSKPISFRMKLPDYHRLERRAAEHGMSVGSFARYLVIRGLDGKTE